MNTKEQILTPQLRFREFEGGWSIKKLSDVGKIITGSTPSTFVSEYYENGIIHFVSPVDIGANRFITSTKTTLTDLGFSKTRHIRENSVLFVCIGSTIGKVAQTSQKCATNQQINAIECNSNNSDSFLYSLLELKADRVKLLAGNQAVPQINKTDFSNFRFYFPKLPEQQKIASFLSDVDAKITKFTQKKAKLEEYKKGIMQKIFNQELRFKDDNGNNFHDWEEKKLGDVCLKKSSSISANCLGENNGEYNIYGATGFLQKVNFYDEEREYIGIVKDGSGVGNNFLAEKYSSVLGTIDKIFPKKSINIYFLKCLLDRIHFEKYKVGSSIPHIYFKDYSIENILTPYIEEQTKIANFLSDIDLKIEAITTKIDNAKTFKKGLLQQMFV